MLQEVIFVKKNDLLLLPKSNRGFVGFGVGWRRGGGWVGEVLSVIFA